MDRRAPQRTAERPPARRAVDPRADLRRRRTNILFLLVITTACTLFLYWTTKSAALMYAFVLSFLALGGYVLLLAQARQRERTDWNNDWIERY
jgi:Flp pilus assembly protein TadB